MGPSDAERTVNNPLCADCPALCCHGLVIPIDKPRTKADVEELKWHVQYDTVSAFIRSSRWNLMVDGRCQYLDEQNLCTRYEDRPDRCRRHNPPDCERYGPYFDLMLKTPEDVERYFARERARKRRARQARQTK